MKCLRTLFSATVILAACVGSAQASLLSVTGAPVSIWQYNNPGAGLITDPAVQALPSALSVLPAAEQVADYTGNYTGPVDFLSPSGGTNTIGAFLASAGGAFAGPTAAVDPLVISTGNFDVTTLINLIITSPVDFEAVILHDDGISVWTAGNGAMLTPLATSAPTVAVPTPFTFAAHTTYSLWYSAANDLPEVLRIDGRVVPEPSSLALLGLGLLGLGALRRRRAS